MYGPGLIPSSPSSKPRKGELKQTRKLNVQRDLVRTHQHLPEIRSTLCLHEASSRAQWNFLVEGNACEA